MEQLCNLLKEPSDAAAEQPEQLYTLRGVATDSHTTYFLHGKAATVDGGPTESSKGSQWWKTQYDIKPEITKQQLTEADVIKAAETEGKEVLLVYASAKAIEQPDIDEDDYPEALKTFVERDNESFRNEQGEYMRPEAVIELPSWDDQPSYDPPAGGPWSPDKGLTASDDSAVDVRSDGLPLTIGEAVTQDADVEESQRVRSEYVESTW